MKLLFTGGGGAGNEAIWQRFSSRYELYFADADQSSIDPVIPQNRRFAIPFANAEGFADEVMGLCQRLGIDILVPGVDEELVKLAEASSEASPTRVLLPPASFVRLMLDKLKASHALAEAGLAVPETRPLTEGRDMDFPLIAKPRSGRGSRGVEKLNRPEQIDAYLAMQDGDPDFYIAQAMCPGQEYTVFVCADEDCNLRAVIPVHALSKKGITIRARVEHQDAILAYAKAFHAYFRVPGIYNIQCMLSDDGRVFPFEVNPRISTTFCLAVSTGFDPFSISKGTDLFVPDAPIHLSRHWKNIIS